MSTSSTPLLYFRLNSWVKMSSLRGVPTDVESGKRLAERREGDGGKAK